MDCLALQQGPATTTTNTLTLELGMDKVNLLQVQIHFVLFCMVSTILVACCFCFVYQILLQSLGGREGVKKIGTS